MTSLRIDPEFRALIPPLTPDERQQLEANLIMQGCRDALVTWREILIDGHNRHEICERHRISYRTKEIELPSRDHVLLWIEENQLGRRNLTDDQRAVIARGVQKRRAALAIRERNKQNRRGKSDVDTAVMSTLPRDQRTSSKVAEQAKISERKLQTVAEIEKKAPEAIPAIRAGQKTILEVKREMRENEREKARAANRAIVQRAPAVNQAAKPEQFQTIVIDPPWDWGDEGDVDQMGRARPIYATMPLEQIGKLPVAAMSQKNAHLYLWITNRSLPKGFGLLDAWGFRYVTTLTWAKPSFGMGNYFRGSTEHILFAVKGSLQLLRRDVGTYFTAPRPKGHSTKPTEFYSLIETCSPGPWLEMFARQERPGWVAWGAEIFRAAGGGQ